MGVRVEGYRVEFSLGFELWGKEFSARKMARVPGKRGRLSQET